MNRRVVLSQQPVGAPQLLRFQVQGEILTMLLFASTEGDRS